MGMNRIKKASLPEKRVITLEIKSNAFYALICILILHFYESDLKIWVFVMFYNLHKHTWFTYIQISLRMKYHLKNCTVTTYNILGLIIMYKLKTHSLTICSIMWPHPKAALHSYNGFIFLYSV